MIHTRIPIHKGVQFRREFNSKGSSIQKGVQFRRGFQRNAPQVAKVGAPNKDNESIEGDMITLMTSAICTQIFILLSHRLCYPFETDSGE